MVNDYTGVDDTAQMGVRAWLYVDMQGARNLSFVAPTPETYATHHEIIELVPAKAPVDDVRLASSAAAYAPFEVLQGRFTVDGQIALGYSIGVLMKNYRETDDECPSCGADARDRKYNKPDEPQGLSECPHCGTEKCCMCDMGDDVECLSCNSDDDHE